MHVPSSILKKMAIGTGGLALTISAGYAVTAPTGDSDRAQETVRVAVSEPASEPTASPEATPTPEPTATPVPPPRYDPCPACGMG